MAGTQESSGAADIIQCLISKRGRHSASKPCKCTESWPGSKCKGQKGKAEGSARWGGQREQGIMVDWQTRMEDRGSVSGTNSRSVFRGAGARSQLWPSQHLGTKGQVWVNSTDVFIVVFQREVLTRGRARGTSPTANTRT